MLSLEPYEPPKITKLPFVAFAKHGPREISAATGFADEVDAAALVAEFGSPLYVVSEAKLRADYRAFAEAFSADHLTTRIAYSVKTNYLPAIVAILKEEGAWAEIVSGMEYDLVRSLGYQGAEMIFNGPHKARAELERALGDGVIVNIDNFDELDRVEQIAQGLDRPARVGIRISFRHGGQGWTKFGFDDDSTESQAALERIAANPRLHLDLLHCHSGTFLLIEEIYGSATERLIALAKRARELGLAPTMIDLGGGYPSANTLRPEYDLPGGSARSGNFWSSYADQICGPLRKAAALFGGKPTLVLEPGRAVVDASVQMLSTVVGRKSVNGANRTIIVDGGVNLVPTAVYYNHGIQRAAGDGNQTPDRHDTVDICGPLCMQSDRLRNGAVLPPLEIGDILAVSHVGAYCHSQSSQFIQTRPATVLLTATGPELIRRRETWRDVFALDNLPERYRPDGCNFS